MVEAEKSQISHRLFTSENIAQALEDGQFDQNENGLYKFIGLFGTTNVEWRTDLLKNLQTSADFYTPWVDNWNSVYAEREALAMKSCSVVGLNIVPGADDGSLGSLAEIGAGIMSGKFRGQKMIIRIDEKYKDTLVTTEAKSAYEEVLQLLTEAQNQDEITVMVGASDDDFLETLVAASEAEHTGGPTEHPLTNQEVDDFLRLRELRNQKDTRSVFVLDDLLEGIPSTKIQYQQTINTLSENWEDEVVVKSSDVTKQEQNQHSSEAEIIISPLTQFDRGFDGVVRAERQLLKMMETGQTVIILAEELNKDAVDTFFQSQIRSNSEALSTAFNDFTFAEDESDTPSFLQLLQNPSSFTYDQFRKHPFFKTTTIFRDIDNMFRVRKIALQQIEKLQEKSDQIKERTGQPLFYVARDMGEAKFIQKRLVNRELFKPLETPETNLIEKTKGLFRWFNKAARARAKDYVPSLAFSIKLQRLLKLYQPAQESLNRHQGYALEALGQTYGSASEVDQAISQLLRDPEFTKVLDKQEKLTGQDLRNYVTQPDVKSQLDKYLALLHLQAQYSSQKEGEALPVPDKAPAEKLQDEINTRENLHRSYLFNQRDIKLDLPDLGIVSAKYVEIGANPDKKNQPTAVVLPGIAGDLETMRTFSEELAFRGYKVICISYPESTLGTVSEEYTDAIHTRRDYSPQADFFNAAINSILSNNESFDLFSYSTGCPVSMEMIKNQQISGRISEITMVAPVGVTEMSSAAQVTGLLKEGIRSIFNGSFGETTLVFGEKSDESDQAFSDLIEIVRHEAPVWYTTLDSQAQIPSIKVWIGDKDNVTQSYKAKAAFQNNKNVKLTTSSTGSHTTPMSRPDVVFNQLRIPQDVQT